MKTLKPKPVLPKPLTAENLHLVPDAGQLSPRHIKHLTADEREMLTQEFLKRLMARTGAGRDAYQQDIDTLLAGEARSAVWEETHALITGAMCSYVQLHGTAPGHTQLSLLTGLSRQTIHRHLKEYSNSPYITEQADKLKVISTQLMFQLSKQGFAGCNKSLKLFFTLTGHIHNAGSLSSVFTQRIEEKRSEEITPPRAILNIGQLRFSQNCLNHLSADDQLKIAQIIMDFRIEEAKNGKEK